MTKIRACIQARGGEMSKNYFTWGREQPTKGQKVWFSVYVQSCVPGNKPLANYQGKGEYLGECADGFMTRATECTEPANVGEVIFTLELWADGTGIAAPKAEIEQTKMPTFWLQRKDGKYDGFHFMDDFGNPVELDFGKLAIIIAEEDLQ